MKVALPRFLTNANRLGSSHSERILSGSSMAFPSRGKRPSAAIATSRLDQSSENQGGLRWCRFRELHQSTTKKPQEFIALGLLRHVFAAPSIRQSHGELRPRSARFRFTRQQQPTTKTTLNTRVMRQKIPGDRGLAPEQQKKVDLMKKNVSQSR